MMSFIHSFENALFAAGMSVANGGSSRRPQERVRVIRESAQGSIAKLSAALIAARKERDQAQAELFAARAEIARLHRALAVKR